MQAKTLPTTIGLLALYTITLAIFASDPTTLITGAVLAIPLVWLSVIDFQTYTIPDVLNLWTGALGLAMLLASSQPILPSVIAAIVVYAFIWAVAATYRKLRGREGLDMGDAKLLAAAAFWVGPLGLPSVILLGSVTGIAVVLTLRVIANRPTDRWLAFGPFLAYGLFWVWLNGPIL